MTIDLHAVAAKQGIKYFLLSYNDLFGTLRAKLVPATAIAEIQEGGAGFAGFANWFDMTPADPDMLARPDPSSLMVLPWKPEVAWVAADLVMAGSNQPVETPRRLLQLQVAKAAKQGYRMKTGVEAEFFLLEPGGRSPSDAADQQEKPCYDQAALMRRFDVISEISDGMITLGWHPYQSDHEDANGQFEMNWRYDDAVVTADRHAFFKYMVKALAEKHGYRATFMPKPMPHLTGSGCHAHVSVWDLDGARNLFADGADALGLSKLAHQFLGGVLHSAEALTAITNPTVNSYKRLNATTTLSGATWAPNAVSWSGNNRTHMVRIPDGGRFELRLADGAANPYLLQAALLVGGLDGVAHGRSPGDSSDVNMAVDGHRLTDIPRLPLNLLDAIRLFGQSEVVRAGFGAGFVDSYVKLKLNEWKSYAASLTEWEIRNTLDC